MKERSDYADEGLEGRRASFWLESGTVPSFPRLEHSVHVDVAIVGGGITGLTTALLLKREGLRVAVIEADRILGGVTGSTTAKITSLHTLIYRHLIAKFGKERARQYADANQAAIGRIEELAREYGIACEFERKPFSTFAESREDRGKIETEVEAAWELGLPASFDESVPLPDKTFGAVRFDGQAQFHPVKYLSGIASAIPDDRNYVFEHSRVVGIAEGEICQVSCRDGSVNAPQVVIATHHPIFDSKGYYFARLHPHRHYVAAVRIPDAFPDGMYISSRESGRAYRAAQSPAGELAIVTAGAGHKTGQGGDTRQYYRELEENVKSLWPGARVEFRWSAQGAETVDKVPYIGRMYQGSNRLFVATGFGGWGMTNGTAAGILLADMLTGRKSPWADVFDPHRFTPSASAKEFLTQNLNVGKEFVKGKLPIRNEHVEDVPPGGGTVVSLDGRHVGVHRDEDGTVTAVDPTCTHLGCTVAWNAAERSWDCPCHGSRYAPDGEVLNGPTVEPLSKIDLEERG